MSPRTPQQFKELREEKMTLIMDVALMHFAGDGYHKTTINQIARQAGISKGLMYNYFESKEALLKAIIHKSVNDVFKYMDLDRDGTLSEEEFEFFIRKISVLLKEKRHFWQLLTQLLMQHDVSKQFPVAFPESDTLIHPGHEPGDNFHPERMKKMISDYFFRKKERIGMDYDPECETNMFFITMMGLALKSLYSEGGDNEKEINRIIELFK